MIFNSAQLNYANYMANVGYKEIFKPQCPVKHFDRAIYFKKETLDDIRYAIVNEQGGFINWESPKEDDIVRKKIESRSRCRMLRGHIGANRAIYAPIVP